MPQTPEPISAVWLAAMNISANVFTYADDTKVVREVTTARDCEELQADLDSIQHWSEKWQMKFNSSKCRMHLGHSIVTVQNTQ